MNSEIIRQASIELNNYRPDSMPRQPLSHATCQLIEALAAMGDDFRPYLERFDDEQIRQIMNAGPVSRVPTRVSFPGNDPTPVGHRKGTPPIDAPPQAQVEALTTRILDSVTTSTEIREIARVSLEPAWYDHFVTIAHDANDRHFEAIARILLSRHDWRSEFIRANRDRLLVVDESDEQVCQAYGYCYDPMNTVDYCDPATVSLILRILPRVSPASHQSFLSDHLVPLPPTEIRSGPTSSRAPLPPHLDLIIARLARSGSLFPEHVVTLMREFGYDPEQASPSCRCVRAGCTKCVNGINLADIAITIGAGELAVWCHRNGILPLNPAVLATANPYSREKIIEAYVAAGIFNPVSPHIPFESRVGAVVRSTPLGSFVWSLANDIAYRITRQESSGILKETDAGWVYEPGSRGMLSRLIMDVQALPRSSVILGSVSILGSLWLALH
jgi:hypothetical protein